MRLTDVWMVSVDQNHSFPGHNLLQLSIRLGCFMVVTRVSCAKVVCCVARHEGGGIAPYLIFLSNNSKEVFLGFKIA